MNNYSRHIFFTSLVAALGGLLFGFDTAVITGAIPYLQSYFKLDAAGLGWAVSCILVGCGLGAVIAGRLADRYGRRTILLGCALLFALSGLGAGWANHLIVFVLFRILGGLGVGAAAMVSPMYIAETVPAGNRGRMVALYQMAIVTGMLLAYTTDYLLAGYWRWMFASQALPAAVFFGLLYFVDETPRWLASKDKLVRALAVLKKTAPDALAELKQVQESFSDHQPARLSELFQRPYAKVVGTGIAVAVFQQASGINAVMYYAPDIFKQTGTGHSDALFQTILVGAVNVLATLIAIAWVDRAGRKRFLVTGSVLMGLCLAGLAACFNYHYFAHYIVLALTLVYVAAFAGTLGAVTWVYLSEIFPNRIRALALSVATLALWLADFGVSAAFPLMNVHWGTSFTLLGYALCCGFAFLVFCYLPETKGKTLEEMEELFNQKK